LIFFKLKIWEPCLYRLPQLFLFFKNLKNHGYVPKPGVSSIHPSIHPSVLHYFRLVSDPGRMDGWMEGGREYTRVGQRGLVSKMPPLILVLSFRVNMPKESAICLLGFICLRKVHFVFLGFICSRKVLPIHCQCHAYIVWKLKKSQGSSNGIQSHKDFRFFLN
jgi:hypothetical protein